MEKKKVLVSGCNGHMGQIVCRLINESSNFEVLYGFDTAAREFSPFPVFEYASGLEGMDIKPDVIIDFSAPKATLEILGYADLYDIPIVIATTGFSESQINVIKNCSASIPIFMSANMSFEIALLKNVLKEIAPVLLGVDIEITEIHHNRKKDAPSGTAKLLADSINESFGNSKKTVYGRTGKRENDEIGISSIRGGNIVGTHTVSFLGQYETLEITHTAHSRELFAEGALKAAEFLIGAKIGLYDMDDLINS